jgi:hypothetical protein
MPAGGLREERFEQQWPITALSRMYSLPRHKEWVIPRTDATRYTYLGDDDERWVITFTRERDLAKSRMIESVHGPKRVLAKLARFDGAYLRFAGTLEIDHRRGAELIEQYTSEAIWELMYFGHARTPTMAGEKR